MRLIATKPLRYANRSINTGESFDTENDMHARLLIGIRSATDPNSREPGSIDPPATEVAAKIAEAVAGPSPDAVTEPAAAEAKPEHEDANAEIAERSAKRGARK